jgi:hypothetical protein
MPVAMPPTLDAWRERAGSDQLRCTDGRERPQGDSDREQHTKSDEVGQAHAAAPNRPGRPGQLTARRLCRFGTLLSSREPFVARHATARRGRSIVPVHVRRAGGPEAAERQPACSFMPGRVLDHDPERELVVRTPKRSRPLVETTAF